MKKLKLRLQDIEGAEVLNRAQLKMVIGDGDVTFRNYSYTTASDCKTNKCGNVCSSIDG